MKKGLAILICVSLLLGIFSTNIFADEKSDTCGDGVTWNFAGGVLTISGNGEIWTNVWSNWYDKGVAIVVIEEGVTGIGGGAFVNCNLLCDVKLPESLISIGEQAFEGCDNLPAINLPGNLKTIGSCAFWQCDNLSSITVPDSVVSIGSEAFAFCDNLRSAVIGSGVISMGNEIFRGCTSLSEITIGKSVKLIGNNAFYNCEALKTVNYCGSKEEWKKVVINEGNEALNNAKFNYNYGGETKNDDVFDSITTEITIGESRAEKTMCTTHTYKSAMGDVCTVCGYKYEPTLTKYENTMEAITANTAVRKAPYAKSGEIVRKLAAGTEVKVTHFLKNSLGNTWYLTEDGYYIYKENLTVKRVYYTLSYNANGGSGVPDKLEVRAGFAVKIHLNIPTRSGYSFKGWAKNRNGSVSYQPGSKLILTENTTLYAVWEKNGDYSNAIKKITSNIVNGLYASSRLGDSGAKYWSWYYGKNSTRNDSWCAVYTSWLVNQAGVSGLKTANPNEQVNKLKAQGVFYKEGYKPKTGDLIFFTKNGSNADHVGMIVINDKGETYILHGNYSRAVKYTNMNGVWTNEPRRVFKDYIMGYGDVEAYVNSVK